MRRAVVLLLAVAACSGEEPVEPPDLSCTTTADCEDNSHVCLPASLMCAPPIGPTAPGDLCDVDDDCATGVCQQGACVELCQTTCSWGVCEAIDGKNYCVWRKAAPVLELGPFPTPAAGGSGPITLDIPAATGSFTIVVSDDGGLRVAVTKLLAPDGTDLTEMNPGIDYIGTGQLHVPISDMVLPVEGAWTIEVGTFDPTNFTGLDAVDGEIERVTVIAEPESERGGALDLVIGITSITASTATTTNFVQSMLGRVEAMLLEPTGATLGSVRFIDVPAEHATVQNGDETRTICRTLSEPGPHGVAVNLFIVDDLTYTGGHAGGVPGPPGVYGTNASCVVLQRLRSGGDTGILAAHELGHFLGLRHTSELDGRWDLISDTPDCPPGVDEGSCPDRDNLMFPRFPLRPNLGLTSGQIDVVQRNPMLYE